MVGRGVARRSFCVIPSLETVEGKTIYLGTQSKCNIRINTDHLPQISLSTQSSTRSNGRMMSNWWAEPKPGSSPSKCINRG